MELKPLDYETPKKRIRKAWPFWIGFTIAYIPGLMVLNTVDDLLHLRATGYHSDGGAVIFSLILSPLFAGVAGLVKRIWRRYDTVGFAVSFAIFAPVLVLLVYVCIVVGLGK